MTSIQSTLGEEDIAEELAAGQRQISIAEFFEKNKHMLGFDSGARAMVTAVKEAVDNALDATEEADFLPDIYVELKETGDYYTLIVEDNGPGITKEEIPNVFGKLLYGSRFHKRKQSLTPEQRLLVRRDGEIEFLPIGVLCDAYLPSAGAGTAPIPDEIQVPSFNRETHEMTWEDVTHAIRHETTEQTYEITTQKGRTVEVTGNHSVFSVTKDGETKEVKAADLSSGDTILTPRQLPTPGEAVESINLLEHITLDQLDGRRVYVYGFDRETLETIRDGDTIRKKPSPDSTRERYYYRYNGVEILRDSLEQNYLDKGYLPAAKVIELGWEEKAADCTLKTYQVGGKETELPVTLPVDKSLMELLGYYVTEGHVGDRQVGFTFGSHETELITATEEAMAQLNGRTTTVERERNSTRVKAFGSPLAMALQNLCGDHARNKQVPGFVFEAPPEQQQQFLAAVYQGDGSDAYPSNQLSHTTTSETLARQLSVLWNMQGVLASTERRNDEHGYADEPTTKYRTSVYGEDVTLAGVFEQTDPTHEQEYKRIPASLLDAVRVDDCPNETVPDTIPGLLLATGIGSSLEHAAVYASLIEDALDGDVVQKPRYVTNLREMGLLDSDHRPTDTLRELWQTVQNLQGLTETDMCLLPVKHIEKTEPPEYVYDISVPGATGRDENFVVANEGALSVKNSRGQQGIGISAAVLYSQLTSGSPAKITSRTPGQSEAQYFELIIDTENNEPEIQTEDTAAWDRPHGTRIELEFEANMRARQQLHDYINHTAIVNPHARIELREPDAHMQFERATDQLPAETEEIRPHPHGVELGTVMKMLAATDSYSLSGFLQGEFTRVGKKTADGIVDAFRDRHFGREMAWTPPGPDRLGDTDLEATIRGAVANKGAEATKAFANAVVEGTDAITGVADRDRIVHHELVEIIDAAAEMIEAEYDTTFGDTVRENAVEAAWAAITTDVTPDCYTIVDEATTSRKDESVVQGLADRLADKFEQADDTRHRLTRSTIEDFVNRAADLTADREDASIGDTARGKIVAALWDRMRTVPDEAPTVRTVADDRDMAANFLEAMRSADVMAPPTNCLSPISAELIEEGLKKEIDADFYTAVTRDAEVHGGDPFIVEAGIAYGGELEDDGAIDVMRFANRVPLVYQRGACATTDVVRSIGWRNYGLDQPGGSGIPNGPMALVIHVASTNVPFTSESKDAIANIPEIEDEIELAIREAARDLKSYLNRRRSLEQRRRKSDTIARILPRMAEKVTEVTGREPLDIEDSLARIMNNVLVEREVENGSVRLRIENYSDSTAELELTDIVSVEPHEVNGATVVEMDGEWFVKWSPAVKSGESITLEYDMDGSDPDDVSFDLSIDGIETEKLTLNA